jgi:hypothetical protein
MPFPRLQPVVLPTVEVAVAADLQGLPQPRPVVVVVPVVPTHLEAVVVVVPQRLHLVLVVPSVPTEEGVAEPVRQLAEMEVQMEQEPVEPV